MNLTHEISSHVIILIIFHESAHQRPATPHSYKNTHPHHRKVPIAGCGVKAAAADVVREEEEVAAALLDEQLW